MPMVVTAAALPAPLSGGVGALPGGPGAMPGGVGAQEHGRSARHGRADPPC